jgi:hypothetical protein
MIEHDRNPASQQAGYPLDEDGPPLGAFQQVAGRDLTIRPGRSARDHDAPPVSAARALILWRAPAASECRVGSGMQKPAARPNAASEQNYWSDGGGSGI